MSQNSIVLPTSGTLSGLQAVTDINAALDTLNTKWSGASAPATPELGQEWLDTSTTPNTLRIYDGSAWVARAWLDTANGLWQPLPTGGLIAVGSITLDHTYVGRLVTDNAAGVTITLPSAASIPAGMRIAFIHQQGGTMTLQRNGTDNLMGPDGWNATSLALTELGDFVEFESDGGGKWYQVGKAAPTPAASLGASGYQKFSSGALLQWGSVTIANNSSATITFPVAFGTACRYVNFISQTNDTGGNANPSATGISTTGATLHNNQSQSVTFLWMAFGY